MHLATIVGRVELLHPIDGWHASVEGHNVLAEAAFRDLGPSLNLWTRSTALCL